MGYPRPPASRRRGRARRRFNPSAQNKLDSFERRLDHISLACQALWELIRETTSLTEEDILAKMEEIDLRDARKDGKMSTTTVKCESCGKISQSHRQTCIYCGEDLPDKKHVFE